MAASGLSDEQYEELDSIINRCHGDSKLSEWELQFMNDIQERFEKFDKNIYLSDKQWAVLRKCYEKVEKE